MRNQTISAILILIQFVCSSPAVCQFISDFENFGLFPDTYLNNSAPEPAFISGQAVFPNDYNPQFDAWLGWAISSVTDNQTPGFLNQHSSIAGSGSNGSPTYAVAYIPSGTVVSLTGAAAGQPCEGVYLTNSTYAYYSMLDGDAFAKQFGGASGNDPDYFRLTIKAWSGGLLNADTIDVYLADYRFEDNSEDYILDEWTWVDLSPLGPADSLLFVLSSTDVGVFGMNTPAYFCLDNLTTAGTASNVKDVSMPPLDVFPNPASEFITLTLPAIIQKTTLILSDANGEIIRHTPVHSGTHRIDISALPPSIYFITIQTISGSRSARFIKHEP
jgi:hypothetical protein